MDKAAEGVSVRWDSDDERLLIEDEYRTKRGIFEMNTMELTFGDREVLLRTFKAFRSHSNETDSDYSNRDELERKLVTTGLLTDLDKHMLLVAVANEIKDQDIFNHFNQLLDK